MNPVRNNSNRTSTADEMREEWHPSRYDLIRKPIALIGGGCRSQAAPIDTDLRGRQSNDFGTLRNPPRGFPNAILGKNMRLNYLFSL